MKWTFLICAFLLVVAFAVPLTVGALTSGGEIGEPLVMSREDWETPAPSSEILLEPPETLESLWGWDGELETPFGDQERWVTVLLDDGLHWMRLNYYLYGVVAGEMPASFPEEALKAQAVAARTYTLYKQAHQNSAHPQAEVCGNSACCKAYASEQALRARWGDQYAQNAICIRKAVDATDTQIITYEDQPILAVFHSTSSGKTERSADVWGEDLPYLQSVKSSGEEASPRYEATVELSAEECKKILLAEYPDMKLSSSAKNWFKSLKRSDAGGVTSIKVGGVTLTGGRMRKLFGLNSSNFTISATRKTITIKTKGYGHGVGMSQYGARALALQGADCGAILRWYYQGVSIVPWDMGAAEKA